MTQLDITPDRRLRTAFSYGDLLLLILIGVVTRAVLWSNYQPQIYPDTGTYTALAVRLRTLSLLDYGGERTPGYPLLLLAANLDSHDVWLLQCILGIGISMICYYIVAATTGSRIAAFAAGAIHTLSLNQLFFEADVLSETLAAFLVTVSVGTFVRFARRPSATAAALLALISAFAALTRPMYVVLACAYAVVISLSCRDARGALTRTAVFCSVFLLPVGLWASVNKAATGQFTMSTLSGYGLSNHAGGFIELAPDKYAIIRDIYLKHREERRATSPSRTHANTAIGARAELLQATGLSRVELSRTLTRMSIELFYSHPLLYARSVMEAWASFWAAANYWNPADVSGPSARIALQTAWRIERILIRAANAAFVLLAAVTVVILAPKWRRLDHPDLALAAIIAVVLSSSILQALVEFGDNPRFGVPTQPLVVCFLAIVAVHASDWLKTRRQAFLARTSR